MLRYSSVICPVKKLLIFFLILDLQGHAQMLDNRNGMAFTDAPFFNEDFIRENKLKRFEGYFVYKKSGALMQETDFSYVFRFDRSGHLISSFETRQAGTSVDTLWNLYEYNLDGLLISHRKTEDDGFNTQHFSYDDQGRQIGMEFTRDYKDSSSNGISRSLAFNRERMEYTDYGEQLKCTRYNSENLPYLDEFWTYNELGYLIAREERIKMTSTVYTYSYEYNEKGKLAAIRKKSNLQEAYLEELVFTYDELENVKEKHLYRNGEFTTDYQFVYNSQSKLLSSVIIRQVSTGFMTIIRFKHVEFYD
jgi:hypothetical protein